jgi:Rne/Rng family ribonuclease
MTRELFVSSTPHETKVGLVEDDQLAEIYLERENEYTLAGSIYKGRVTRVLPGMQSAFVDIGLERDAFLYVSDFMELEDQDEVEEVPTGRAPSENRNQESVAAVVHSAPVEAGDKSNGAEASQNADDADPKDRNAYRGRRRRRGRGRERFPESKYARPAPEPQRPERQSYGPPAGYEPMILPGESISKYKRTQPAAPSQMQRSESTSLARTFPEDEPGFATAQTAGETEHELQSTTEGYRARFEPADSEEQREPGSELQAAAIEEPVEEVAAEELVDETQDDSDLFSVNPVSAAAGITEEEEIEEEEADLAHYVEALEEDDAFEELEEETLAAGEYHSGEEIAASVETSSFENVPFSPDPVAVEETELAQAEELDEIAAQEAEIEEAQAEAEAVLDAEARGNGTVDARVEVRGPAATAAYTQRAGRPAFDRRGPRNRRGGGGRRFRRHEPQNLPQITDLLKEGQEILVQIAKEPIGKKGARITSHIALPGRFLVYMPTVNHTGVSRKIASDEERQRLKRIIMSERENGHGGFIVRTAAQNASEDELRADIRFLKGLWAEIRSRADNSKPPALIYHDLNVVERVLRDQVTSDFSAIWVDTEQEYERILRFANRFQPALVRRVKLYSKETPLFEQFGLTDEVNKALKSKVWLKSGGYIVINQTEALVAIDVNTGKYVGKTARLEDTIVKTNVDAIKEIVRQIRLRDLGGIIVIDFIDMDERRNRQKVMQALEEALRGDRAPSKVLQFNDFGLVAITRKRVKQSLERTIGTPCPYCSATGFVKSVNTVCNEIYVEMRKLSKHLEHPDVMLRVNPEVAKALKTNSGRALNEMEELTKKTVIVKSDPALHQEQFDIN